MKFIKALIAKIKAWLSKFTEVDTPVAPPVTASPVEPSRPIPEPSKLPPGYPPLSYGSTTYNPDDYNDVGYRYEAWILAGRPVKDVKGRDLDVRGDYNRSGAQFGPLPPVPPAASLSQMKARDYLAGKILRGDPYSFEDFDNAGIPRELSNVFVRQVKGV